MMVEAELRRLIQAIEGLEQPTDEPDVEIQDFPLVDPVRVTQQLEQASKPVGQGTASFFTSPSKEVYQSQSFLEETQELRQNPELAATARFKEQTTTQRSWFARWGGGDSGDLSGFIPQDALAPIEGQRHFMRPDAAKAYKAMQRAARKDGIDFSITDSYRSYNAQVALKKAKPSLAATPGHSNHGWGLALDVNVNNQKTYDWLRKNGKKFGFEQPMSYEPWHWEYGGGYAPTTRKSEEGRRPKAPRRKKQAADPLNRITRVSSFITAPIVFGDVVSEIENVPRDPKVWKATRETDKLKFVPARYRNLIREAADSSGLPARLIALVIQKESGFDPKAVSSAGAQGLMQVMPLHDLKTPFSPKANVMFGSRLLANYIEQMGSLRLGLAAYNAGPNNHQAGLGYADALLDEYRGASYA